MDYFPYVCFTTLQLDIRKKKSRQTVDHNFEIVGDHTPMSDQNK